MSPRSVLIALCLSVLQSTAYAVVFIPFIFKSGGAEQESEKTPSAIQTKPKPWLERFKLRDNAQLISRKLGVGLSNICTDENRHILLAQRRSCFTLQDVYLSSGDYVLRANFSFDNRNELVRVIAFFPPQRNGSLTENDCIAANEQVKSDISRAYPDAKVFKAARSDATFGQIESQAWLVENEGSFEVELFTKSKRENTAPCQVRISRSI